MKVCLVNNLYKPYHKGGAERITELIAQGLKKLGHEVFIITTKPLGRKCKKTDEERGVYYIKGLFYDLYKIPKIFRFFWHLVDIVDIGSYLRIRSILKANKPDIVMTHNLEGISYLIPRAIKRLKIKHIHTLHDIQLLHPSGLMLYQKEKKINSIYTKIYQLICRILFKTPAVIISPSKWLLSMHLQRNFFNNIKHVVLPNPVEMRNYQVVCKYLQDKSPRFLYAGQIEEHKGILFLIEVFKNSGYKLTIIGNGTKEREVKKLVSDNNNMKFKNWISEEDTIREMSNFHCLIVPSLCYENSPIIIYQAVMMGLPVIASRIGGIAELIHDLGGILFTPDDKIDLMKKIKWAVNHPLELHRIGEKGKKKTDQFSIDNYINKLIELI